jgi:hypothetical protein
LIQRYSGAIDGKTYAFACAIKGDLLTGKDARLIVEAVLERNEYL